MDERWAEDHVTSGTYQRSLLHALCHHEKDLLRLAAAVVEGFLDGDQQLIFDAVTQWPAGETPDSHVSSPGGQQGAMSSGHIIGTDG